MINPFEIVKNASAIKEQMNKIKDELANTTATGSSGGNMVKITLNGQFELKSIQLDPICVDNRDIEMLQDLIIAAHHDAMDKMQEMIKSKTGSIMGTLGDLNIPGL